MYRISQAHTAVQHLAERSGVCNNQRAPTCLFHLITCRGSYCTTAKSGSVYKDIMPVVERGVGGICLVGCTTFWCCLLFGPTSGCLRSVCGKCIPFISWINVKELRYADIGAAEGAWEGGGNQCYRPESGLADLLVEFLWSVNHYFWN